MSNELLSDIELGRLRATDMARRTSRLARLLDDIEAMEWLSYEVSGYPRPLTEDAARAATRSNRGGEDGSVTASLAEFEASAQATELQLQQPPTAPANLGVDSQQRAERSGLRKGLWEGRGAIEKIVGSFHEYPSQRNLELRFGSAVESAFEVVRGEVDSVIGRLVPHALPKLSSAFENAVSDNPEDWAAAAATCRRLLKAVADALQPPGEDVEMPEGRTIKMGDGNYINRLVVWISRQSESDTAADLAKAELEFLGRRLDAADSAGQKGAHSEVTRQDASRFITATYLILGDILRMDTDVGTT